MVDGARMEVAPFLERTTQRLIVRVPTLPVGLRKVLSQTNCADVRV
jgi:hypothetical protein